MKVAVIGGTGRMGRAIAKQLSRENQVVIGSRDPSRAREAALGTWGGTGDDYRGAARQTEASVLAIPYPALGQVSALKDVLSDKLVVSAVNPLKAEGGLLRYALEKGSAAEEIAGLLPRSHVATAFNNVSSFFFEREEVAPMDILVAADSRDTYEWAARLVRTVPNLRPLYAGPLSQAEVIERITPLVLNLATLNGTGSLSTRFVSTKDTG
jgi:8-hydroxy-5-deazaflavin:NADPH oxidoreductase